MSKPYDVIVLGLGGMGSAAAYHLAKRGQRVLGLERFTAPHDKGSSHGRSRIIRQAYFEDPAYVPLLLRSYELWDELERTSGQQLLTTTGGLMMGHADSGVVAGSLRSAEEHNLPHEMLDAAEIRRRYPVFTVSDDTVALYEARAGILVPENCIAAHLDLAARHGAELRFEEPAFGWEASASGDGVRVTTAQGSYEAARLVLSPGPWAPDVMADLNLPLLVERQVLFWFDPVGSHELFMASQLPIFIWEFSDGLQFYGFPIMDGMSGGVKVSYFRLGEPCTPETIDRRVHDDEIARIRRTVAECLPAANGRLLDSATCMYTTTPDHHFVLSLHPKHPQVVIASPCSGHGFKFASVIGEILADLAVDGTTRHPIGLFAPERFSSAL